MNTLKTIIWLFSYSEVEDLSFPFLEYTQILYNSLIFQFLIKIDSTNNQTEVL